MDALRQLESGVAQLLARLENVSGENTRLHAELAANAEKNQQLLAEIARLQGSLAAEVALRHELSAHVEAILSELERYITP